jgi:hypothetical protein
LRVGVEIRFRFRDLRAPFAAFAAGFGQDHGEPKPAERDRDGRFAVDHGVLAQEDELAAGAGHDGAVAGRRVRRAWLGSVLSRDGHRG